MYDLAMLFIEDAFSHMIVCCENFSSYLETLDQGLHVYVLCYQQLPCQSICGK